MLGLILYCNREIYLARQTDIRLEGLTHGINSQIQILEEAVDPSVMGIKSKRAFNPKLRFFWESTCSWNDMQQGVLGYL
jgi:hypothetical protein